MIENAKIHKKYRFSNRFVLKKTKTHSCILGTILVEQMFQRLPLGMCSLLVFSPYRQHTDSI